MLIDALNYLLLNVSEITKTIVITVQFFTYEVTYVRWRVLLINPYSFIEHFLEKSAELSGVVLTLFYDIRLL